MATIFKADTVGNYPIVSEASTANATTIEIWVAATDTADNTTSFSTMAFVTDDVTHYEETLRLPRLTEGQTIVVDIELTCSYSGGITITHSMVANGALP